MPVSRIAPELLAPAGDWDCAAAAIAYGADAIYFGLDIGFNARARAKNFHLDDLNDLMTLLHRNGVKGFVTLNTLIFNDELPLLEANVRRLADSGIDAVIVQDLGAARLINRIAPSLAIHGSTQMTMTAAETMLPLADLNLQRIVLARELSIKEIRKITATNTTPVEVFVHGALCVAYSGQCLTSESLGGRSANRGQCAQACRLQYDLICDGKLKPLADNKYLLSPLDLAAFDHVPDLIEAGVCSFKIEGRLKSPEYVANIVSHYRAAIDSTMLEKFTPMSKLDQFEMELSFSRGFSPGWLAQTNHKRLVPGISSSKRGVQVGVVDHVRGETIIATLSHDLANGDGIVVQGDRSTGDEIGGRIYHIRPSKPSNSQYEISLQFGAVPVDCDLAGKSIFLTHSPAFSKRWNRQNDQQRESAKRPLTIEVHAVAGEPLRMIVSTAEVRFELIGEDVLQVARKLPATAELFEQQFSRLGGTPFQLQKIDAVIDGTPMVPLSVLGTLRRQMLEQLAEKVAFVTPHPLATEDVYLAMLEDVKAKHNSIESSTAGSPQLNVLCRSLNQIEPLLELGIRSIYCELHDIRQYPAAVACAHAADAKIVLVPLRIHKPGETGLLRSLAKGSADAWLVRNLAALQFAIEAGIETIGDFSLNVTNALTFDYLMSKGLRRATASYDLNRDQLLSLVDAIPAERLEVVVHQHMPMFHMEHCVFCTVLSPGTNKSNCGRPCDQHRVHLRDRVGTEHFLDADIGCRNTLYNGRAQSGAEAVPTLIQRGVRQFRVELLPTASVSEIQTIIPLYRKLLAGQIAGGEVWKALKADNRIGVTRGTMEQSKNPLAIL